MGKLDDFDLDVKVKKDEKTGVTPSWTSRILCSGGCPTAIVCHERVV